MNQISLKAGGLPIYDRGGENVRILHAAYATSFETTIGLKDFQDVVNFSTKRGETKAGLSMYYIWFRSLSQLFEGMLQRMAEMPYNSCEKNRSINLKLKGIDSLWK